MIKIKIHHDNWKVYFLEEEPFIRKFGEGIAAITSLEDKCIYFHDGEINRDHVTHEVVHAYYSYLCLNSTTLNNAQLEEVFCDMVAIFGRTIMKQSNHIFREFKKEFS